MSSLCADLQNKTKQKKLQLVEMTAGAPAGEISCGAFRKHFHSYAGSLTLSTSENLVILCPQRFKDAQILIHLEAGPVLTVTVTPTLSQIKGSLAFILNVHSLCCFDHGVRQHLILFSRAD